MGKTCVLGNFQNFVRVSYAIVQGRKFSPLPFKFGKNALGIRGSYTIRVCNCRKYSLIDVFVGLLSDKMRAVFNS